MKHQIDLPPKKAIFKSPALLGLTIKTSRLENINFYLSISTSPFYLHKTFFNPCQNFMDPRHLQLFFFRPMPKFITFSRLDFSKFIFGFSLNMLQFGIVETKNSQDRLRLSSLLIQHSCFDIINRLNKACY